MGDTSIEWTNKTWNPIRARRRGDPIRSGWHCEPVSPGCANCYAERINKAGRSLFTGTRLPYKPGHRKDVEIFLDEKTLVQPLHWRKPQMIFPCSMTDLFGFFVPDAMIVRIAEVMAACPQHIFQVLTKRPARAQEIITRLCGCGEHWPISGKLLPEHPLPNVWLGTSVEDQQRANERIPILLDTPAAVRWLSCEPLLGPLDFSRIHVSQEPPGVFRSVDALSGQGKISNANGFPLNQGEPGTRIDWVVVGGESGPGARPMHPDWARSLRDQCAGAGVPFLFKQWGAWAPTECFDEDIPPRPPKGRKKLVGECFGESSEPISWLVGKKAAGRVLDGRTHDEYPRIAA